MALSAKILAGIVVAVSLAGAYWLLQQSGTLAAILSADALHARIVDMGPWGPVAIIVLMMLAIMLSPIPSAPIALAAGAAYGHLWGMLYVLTGAEAGALGAFVVLGERDQDVARSCAMRLTSFRNSAVMRRI